MLYGLLGLSFWGYVIAILLMTHITIVGITVFLHRCQAHRALELHPVIAHFFRLWLWLTTGMNTKEWVAVHRKHHAKCETEEDPHSPVILGIKKVFFEGAELYQEAAADSEMVECYGHGTPDDWMERHIYGPYINRGVVIMLILDLILFGVPGITVWALQMLWTPLFAAGVVNGIGHYWGYRNYECPDAGKNIIPWGIFLGGEELHNNHHTFGSSAKLSVKWWEIDIGWGYITVFKLLGLAKVKRLPPELHQLPSKTHMDIDTLKAVVANRFQVMANYSKGVILPVLREEKEKAGGEERSLFRRAKTLLVRDASLVDDRGKRRLAHLLEHNDVLQHVYQFRMQLQAIWAKTTASHKELLDALQDWCHRAEETGIKALQDFAADMRAYSLTPAMVKV